MDLGFSQSKLCKLCKLHRLSSVVLIVNMYYISCIILFVSDSFTIFFVTHNYVIVTCNQMCDSLWHHANINPKSKKI